MRKKIWRILLIVSFLIISFLAINEGTQLNIRFEADYHLATDLRSNFVISSDFDWVKQSLIETHRDYWELQRKANILHRNNLLLMSFLGLVMMVVTVKELMPIRAQIEKKE